MILVVVAHVALCDVYVSMGQDFIDCPFSLPSVFFDQLCAFYFAVFFYFFNRISYFAGYPSSSS